MTHEGRTPDGSLVSDYDYDLSPDRIARYPAERREDSRLLVLEPAGVQRRLRFSAVGQLFGPGDVLVLNESKVLPARLLGRKPTGGAAEVFLLRPAADGSNPALWEALVRPGRKLKPGNSMIVADDLAVEILDHAPGGGRVVRLVTDVPVQEALERHGHVPLPPYIDRDDEPSDRERYQTVYARAPGSVAAPTAGLHFTRALLDRLDASGVQIVSVTLHVGIGTFRPIDVEDPGAHQMHHERYVVSPETADVVNRAREEGRRVWAVGTTSVRTLESAVDAHGRLRPGEGSTDLFIRPPYRFRVVDCLLTNFHLPRSTLLMLVSALAGYDRTMGAYRTAIEHGYRFYSYGDAMAVVVNRR